MPKSQSKLKEFQKLLVIKAIRQDHITSDITNYIRENMDDIIIEYSLLDMISILKEASYITPIICALFSGIVPTKNFEELGVLMGKSIEKGIFIYIPLGQGQEDGANKMLEKCAKEGKMDYVSKPSFNTKIAQNI